jgi:hypothetical protein
VFPDGKNKLLINGITSSIRTRSYPSRDQPRKEPRRIDLWDLERLDIASPILKLDMNLSRVNP